MLARVARLILLVAVLALAAPAAAPAAPPNPILSAFFGLDNALPAIATFACPLAIRGDGMPVVLREEIDIDSLRPGDFTVVTRAGRRLHPVCATTVPANQRNEDRTVLLLGELGSATSDPPEIVVVAGLRDKAGAAINGSVAVIPLAAGPTVVYAEPVFREDGSHELPPHGGQLPVGYIQHDTPCPAGAAQSVRVTWTGGVTAPGGAEEGDAQRRAYRVRIEDPRGRVRSVVPAALADLGDKDNNVILCLAQHGRPLSVAVAAGAVVDPGGDFNPATGARVVIDPLDRAAGIVASDPDATAPVPRRRRSARR